MAQLEKRKANINMDSLNKLPGPSPAYALPALLVFSCFSAFFGTTSTDTAKHLSRRPSAFLFPSWPVLSFPILWRKSLLRPWIKANPWYSKIYINMRKKGRQEAKKERKEGKEGVGHSQKCMQLEDTVDKCS